MTSSDLAKVPEEDKSSSAPESVLFPPMKKEDVYIHREITSAPSSPDYVMLPTCLPFSTAQEAERRRGKEKKRRQLWSGGEKARELLTMTDASTQKRQETKFTVS